ncbi:MAG: TetR/AcrR family transcriptional regulator [Bacteroides sp.]|nr:TetR/AcrR family transcriptional regulator [Eubacterium sp.]MCM1417732.1 TetR/AcrR family transcriptional regulator [Roseburia sp.]MCM1461377.1 TetR/AcrR family transcriptional regulator [Bacteroides sp.]
MPPKAKFTEAEIVKAALAIVREEGFDALTARALGERLGSSARPIFTVFKSTDEIRQAVIAAARAMYREYIRRGLAETPAFKGVGRQYILFSVDEPKLFRLLFMNEYAETPTLANVLPIIDENYETILASVKDGYDLPRDAAERLYRHLWIYTHGIAALCATRTCRFTGEEIDTMMTEVFIGLLKSLKN